MNIKQPQTAADIRAFLGSNYNSLAFGRADESPCDEDVYSLSAHDLLSAFECASEDALSAVFTPDDLEADNAEIVKVLAFALANRYNEKAVAIVWKAFDLLTADLSTARKRALILGDIE